MLQSTSENIMLYFNWINVIAVDAERAVAYDETHAFPTVLQALFVVSSH